MQDWKLVIPCLLGLEGLVAEELRKLEAKDVVAENGRVRFVGDDRILARANLWSRYGERVLIEMGKFPARSFEELFQGVKNLPWEMLLTKDDGFPVKGSSVNSKLHSVPDCQKIIKKAIVERLKSKYGLSWFLETDTIYQVQFFLYKDQVSILVDTSGVGLHKRGYRSNASEAPLKETLAAAMVYLARVRRDGIVYDPFCGSGTLLIEAALYAKNIAPGLRRTFAAEQWGQIDSAVWQQERQRAVDLVQRENTFTAFGSDIDKACVTLTLENAKKAGVIDCIKATVADISAFSPTGERGDVITNPPYGERLLDIQQARELYRTMGKRFVPQPKWSYTVISPDEQFEKCFGRKADRRRKLYNGMIRCQVYQFYKGGK